MLLLVPHLYPDPRLLEAATQNLRLPALETLLARGMRSSCPAEGTEAALCQALGIQKQTDWPIAPITLQADNGSAGDSYWLRADPVHLQVMRDRIVLTDHRALNVSPLEARALAETISRHFGEAFSPIPCHPQRWYLEFPRPPGISTTPLSMATGRDIDPLLPQGEDALQIRTLLNELQMLLFSHPVNQAREERGEPTINSLWLWGGGRKPDVQSTTRTVHAGGYEAHALGRYSRTPVHPLAGSLHQGLPGRGDVYLLDTLAEAGQCGDAYGWRGALETLERDWFAPLRNRLGTLAQKQPIELLDPISGKTLLLKRSDAWKFWRRGAPLASILE